MLSITRKSVFQRTLETGREKHNYKHCGSVSVTHWYCLLQMNYNWNKQEELYITFSVKFYKSYRNKPTLHRNKK